MVTQTRRYKMQYTEYNAEQFNLMCAFIYGTIPQRDKKIKVTDKRDEVRKVPTVGREWTA